MPSWRLSHFSRLKGNPQFFPGGPAVHIREIQLITPSPDRKNDSMVFQFILRMIGNGLQTRLLSSEVYGHSFRRLKSKKAFTPISQIPLLS